jgi:hypothetical protein
MEAHQVTVGDGCYIVKSKASGRTYIVTPVKAPPFFGADCTCKFGRHTSWRGPYCSHVLAVNAFAQEVLNGEIRSESALD